MHDGANYYRVRAEEVRTCALAILDLKERTRIMQIADGYVRLANATARSKLPVARVHVRPVAIALLDRKS